MALVNAAVNGKVNVNSGASTVVAEPPQSAPPLKSRSSKAGSKGSKQQSKQQEAENILISIAKQAAQSGQTVYLTNITIQSSVEEVKFSNELLKVPDEVCQVIRDTPQMKSLHKLPKFPKLSEARNKLTARKQQLQKECKMQSAGGSWIVFGDYKDDLLHLFFDPDPEIGMESLCAELVEELVAELPQAFADYQLAVTSLLVATGITQAEADGIFATTYSRFYTEDDIRNGFFVAIDKPKPLLNPSEGETEYEKRAAESQRQAIQRNTQKSLEGELNTLSADLDELLTKENVQDRSLKSRLDKYAELEARVTMMKTVLSLQTEGLEERLARMQQQIKVRLADDLPKTELEAKPEAQATEIGQQSATEQSAEEDSEIDPEF
jgi:hypothetical protein